MNMLHSTWWTNKCVYYEDSNVWKQDQEDEQEKWTWGQMCRGRKWIVEDKRKSGTQILAEKASGPGAGEE